ncbi:MAG: helix-turn-helix transcriptional regulator, partial [Pseudomonadota bacterium]
RGRPRTKPELDEKVLAANPVDRHVGARLELRRSMLGVSQTKLADAIGVKFPQVQKYEKGTNRISASRLFAASQYLDVPISFFFDDMPAHVAVKAPGEISGMAEAKTPYVGRPLTNPEILHRPETVELVSLFYRIEDRRTRQSVVDLLRRIGEQQGAIEDVKDEISVDEE